MTAPNELPITPETAHLRALLTAARDGGVCVDLSEPDYFDAYVREMRRKALAWEGV